VIWALAKTFCRDEIFVQNKPVALEGFSTLLANKKCCKALAADFLNNLIIRSVIEITLAI